MTGDAFAACRPRLLGIAYGMLGELTEAERLDLALLGALERLNPIERAALVLRDVFDLEYAEIADVLEKTPANVRQIARRARDHAGDQSRRRTVSEEERRRLADAFLAGPGPRLGTPR